MFKSIEIKLVALYLSLVFIVMVVSTFYIQYRVAENYRNGLRKEARMIFEYSKTHIENGAFPPGTSPPKNIEEIEQNLKNDKNILEDIIKSYLPYFQDQKKKQKEVYILNRQGLSFFEEQKENFSFTAVTRAMNGKEGEYVTADYMEFAFPITYWETEEVYAIFVLHSPLKEGLGEQLGQINKILLTATAFAMILTIVLGFMLSKTLTGPIKVLTQKAQLMSEGNFTERINVKSTDEIGRLTENFNHMAFVLRKTLQEVSWEKQKMETVLHHMTDGVIAFNRDGLLLHMNPAAKELLKIAENHMDFQQVFQKFDLPINFSDFMGNTNIKPVIMPVEDKFIHIYFAPYGNHQDSSYALDGLIVVLQDVTEQKKLEDMRKEFVANVSHELRTPLTTIKTYTETLLDGAIADMGTAQNFLQVVDNEADRMTRLVQDLLELSRIDNKQVQFNFETVNIALLTKRIVESQQVTLENSSQKLQFFTMGDIPNIEADRHRIEQVILNVLNNSIKYSGGDSTIKTLVEKYNDMVKIQIVDNGVGIPSKDLPRIFERFYRVDKARSRQLGGTGLGLSIAKEIIENHGGNISLESEEGKGTRVMILLPIENQKAV